MLGAGVGVAYNRRFKFIGSQVELISNNHMLDFAPRQTADFRQIDINGQIDRQDQRATMRGAFCQSKGSRCDIHLAVTDKKITVAADPLKLLF